MSNNEFEQAVLRQWMDWQERAIDRGVVFEPDDKFRQELLRVWEGSDYVVQCCLREPELLVSLAEGGGLVRSYAHGEMSDRLEEALAGVENEAALQSGLRRFRRWEMVRIIWRDLSSRSPLGETMGDLSDLADACIIQSVGLLYGWAVSRQGIPRDEEGAQQYLVVLGMGKLGARELNLSSDIDLIFTYPHQGETDGPRHQPNEQFFIRLCQQLVKALNTQTMDGFVFRVDTRLRPFGESGPLAMSFGAMDYYFQYQAREWERYAMIKARIIVGEPESNRQLEDMLRPFVYRRYLDFGAVDSIRNMKQLISRELLRKGMADNIKLGPGGIREIEFIGQAFQLVRGGRDPDLQIRPILEVLGLLGEKGLLPEYLVEELSRAYEFLRLVENRLQAWKDWQTHLLPENETGRLRLSRAMGLSEWEPFSAELAGHRHSVQSCFDKLFTVSQEEDEPGGRPLLAIWEGQLEGEAAAAKLHESGFNNGVEVLRQLDGFRLSHAYKRLGKKGSERLDQLMPLLLEEVVESVRPDVTLKRLLRLLEAIAMRTAYLALLVESPRVLSQLVRLTCDSPWIAERIARHPLLLDELLDTRRLFTPLRRGELDTELSTLLSAVAADDLEQQMDRLRQFARSNKLRVAAADITGAIPLMVVSDYLTDIAESVLCSVLEQAWRDLTDRYGNPPGVTDQNKGFAVIGYGKLGGIELGYGSDLDLVFLNSGQNVGTMTDGEHSVSSDLFYARLGQRIIHILTTRTPAGLLYETDMRLRPNGNSGMLVSSLDTFEAYQKQNAWTWEHQALLRARAIAGDEAVSDRFQQIRREVLSQNRDADRLRKEVRNMREKMRAIMDKSGPTDVNLKQGRGGIADIEFMVQYLVLRWAFRHSDLLVWTDNIRLLDALARHRILDGEIAGRLADVYRTLRAVVHRNALGDLPGIVADTELVPERQLVRDAWQSLMCEEVQ
ncbi:MAG: bifunctional [glutamate--ammonia ligase]-adenylyl-L-tyrosine phosphorylase/[glutamate--ammonia-ligase] adenylyltransferase [Gammaproteobacteria bacterium]|nr:bifunctional [glutamate--ammonia ligase]-adenylyl-L-tyrosine phosphorylase/[glutamate--ammonia-ligase] adenylyltransferase [Gammaproteobacteria bacterium]